VLEASIELNYTTVLNIVFLVLAAVLVWRFVKTGGVPMLKMMGEPADHSDSQNTGGCERTAWPTLRSAPCLSPELSVVPSTRCACAGGCVT
jgi:hypothetical protein